MVSRCVTNAPRSPAWFPPRRQHTQRAQRDGGRGRGAQHGRAQPDGDGTGSRAPRPARRERCHPPGPPPASPTSPAPRTDPSAAHRPTRAAPAPCLRTPPRHRSAGSAPQSTARRRPTGCRRDGIAVRRRVRPRASAADPCRRGRPSQRATQRAACQATKESAPASVASSIGQLGTLGFRQRLDHSHRRLDRRRPASVPPPGPAARRGRSPRRTAGQTADAVAEHQLLAAADASHGGGVEAFVAVDDGQLTAVGQRVDVEQARQLAPRP